MGDTQKHELSPEQRTQKRNTALLRYLAVLFGVAFLLVMLTYLIQLRDSNQTISQLNQSNASALQNAEQLQEENRALTTLQKEMSEEIKDLEKQLEQAQSHTTEAEEDLEAAYNEVTIMETMVKDTLRGYEWILTAQIELAEQDYDSMETTLNVAAEYAEYLGVEGQKSLETLTKALADGRAAQAEAEEIEE